MAAALDLPPMRRGLPEVLAGASALRNTIRWVHTGEVPNMATLLRGGELLLTTGMGVGAGATDQKRFVADLAGRGVAALVIELGQRFRAGVPAALVSAAEQHGLPLVALHAEVPFVAVTEAIHTEIVNRHYSVLRRAERLQDDLTTLLLEGGGIPGVLATLADAVGNPAFLEGADRQLQLHASPASGGGGEDPVGVWTQVAADAETVGVVAPVPSVRGEPGRLVVLPITGPLDAFSTLAVNRAAGMIALALLHTRQERELLARGRGDLLSDLAAGRTTAARAAERARSMGFEDRGGGAVLPLVARLGAGRDRSWAPVLRDLERELATARISALLGIDASGGDLLTLLALHPTDDRAALVDDVAGILRRTAPGDAHAAVVVVAGLAGPWSSLADELRDVIASTAAAARLPARAWHDAAELPLHRLLSVWGGGEELTTFVSRVLDPLIAHDEHHTHQLMATLEALCEHGGRKAETARALHLNRQALYHRIARLREILARDVTDPNELLILHVALHARRQTRPDATPRRPVSGN